MKIVVHGLKKEPIEIVELHIHAELESFVWLELVDEAGNKYQIGSFKEVL